MKDLNYYKSLPWTVHGRAVNNGGEQYYLITIAELPGFSVAADTRGAAEREFSDVLSAYLKAALAAGVEIPTPDAAPAATGPAA